MARGDYSGLYSRIESTFDIEDITPEVIESYLTEGRVGRHQIKYGKTRDNKQRYATSKVISGSGLSGINRLAQDIGNTGIIWEQAHEAEDSARIKELQKEANNVVVHQKKLKSYLNERENELIKYEKELERDVSDVRVELDSVAKDINEEEVAEKELVRYELDLQKEQEVSQIPDDYSDSERIRAEFEIERNLEKLEKERVKEIERSNYEKIRDLLQRKQEFEEIIKTTKDKRKRENAKRNITKITRRMK